MIDIHLEYTHMTELGKINVEPGDYIKEGNLRFNKNFTLTILYFHMKNYHINIGT